MFRKLILLSVFTISSLTASPVGATNLVDTLVKGFNKVSRNNEGVVAKITLQTEIPEVSGDRTIDFILVAYRTQAKLISVFKKNGWQPVSRPLLPDVIDAGLVELELDKGMSLNPKETLKLKVFISRCDWPMLNYQDRSLEEFFQNQVLEKAEQCFTDAERLHGKNSP